MMNEITNTIENKEIEVTLLNKVVNSALQLYTSSTGGTATYGQDGSNYRRAYGL